MGTASEQNVKLKLVSRLWLLASLLLSLLVLPLVEELQVGRSLLVVGLTAVLIAASLSTRIELRTFLLVFAAVAVPLTWATLLTDATWVFVLHCVLGSTFLWFVGGGLVYWVVKEHVVTIESIFGASSAYLLFGLAWALAYWATASLDSSAISFPERAEAGIADGYSGEDFSTYVYYSFVTMTTLGYGDVTPVSRIARTLTWLQAVTGQFYVTVVIAWLVSGLARPAPRSDAT